MKMIASHLNKFLVLFTLALTSIISNADWIKFAESKTFTYYYDSVDFSSNTIKRSRDSCDSPGCKRIYFEENSPLQKKWILINYFYAGTGNVKSSRMLLEFNCKKIEYRMISKTNFIQPMGNGEIVTTFDYGSNKKLDYEHEVEVLKYFEKVCESKTK